ncbi:hypothetical protein [Sphingomonas sp.]|uniref:hypothetical protein n=1 Tax=Sphingomonas sp. TaxID=28214 RepID=UPI0025ED1C12|nr:hypothetical protein [Sphingomonas sp.]
MSAWLAALMIIAPADADPVTNLLNSLAGEWAIVEHGDGKDVQGLERWSVGVAGQIYFEHYDAGSGNDRTLGSAAIWKGDGGKWRGVWCQDGQGCMNLHVAADNGELVIIPDPTAPAELRSMRERFVLKSPTDMEQVIETCSEKGVCVKVLTVTGRRR